MRNKRLLTLALLLAGMFLQTASAGLVVYLDGDLDVGPGGARPNSDSEAAAFGSAISGSGSVNAIDFEDLAVGPFISKLVAPGVTVTLNGTDASSVNGITEAQDVKFGYNTTAAGSKHLRVCPEWGPVTGPVTGTASAVFSFDTPIQVFGAYLTGVDTANGDLHVLFNDGIAQELTVPGYLNGGVQFFGFTSFGSSISSIELKVQGITANSRDIFGIDEIRFGSVPEPATMILLGLGGLMLRKRKQ